MTILKIHLEGEREFAAVTKFIGEFLRAVFQRDNISPRLMHQQGTEENGVEGPQGVIRSPMHGKTGW